jgi:hypothetical protein
MKLQRISYVFGGLLAALVLGLSWSMVGLTQTTSKELAFRGTPNKEIFVLGEPVSVKFEILNKGDTDVKVHAGGVETGFLKVFVRNDEGEYKRYFGYGWGLILGRMIDLSPDKSVTYNEVRILWNGKTDVSHLNESRAREALNGRITTEYAFPEPGVYFVKGISYVGENAQPIESEPVRIEVAAPEGDDLAVWNRIKGNREIALLLQTGAFDTGKEEIKRELTASIEEIITRYPNSMYSGYLKPNLEKYKADELRRKESMERAKIKANN